MRWPWSRNPQPDSPNVRAAERTAEHAKTVLLAAQQRGLVVDRVSTRSNELRKRNHFGEAIDACMERK
ncbi:DUF7620 family protein [Rhodococcoides trifolii]|uniref:DUF7620 family protein n=1 Tax=Rhodococcoides trifolii TaxID=908250 RepID=UPI003FA7EBD2